MALTNPGFETGNTSGWSVLANGSRPMADVSVITTSGYVDTGTYALEIKGISNDFESGAYVLNGWKPLIKPGSQVTVSARVRSKKDALGYAFGWVGVRFSKADGSTTDVWSRMLATNEMRFGYTTLSVTATAPPDALYAQAAVIAVVYNSNRIVYFDTCTMTVEEADSVVTLTYPVNGTTYPAAADVPFRAVISDGYTADSLKYVVTNTSTAASEEYTPVNSDWSMLVNDLDEGTYSIVAKATIGSSEFTSNSNTFSVGASPPKTTREFQASNAYTRLIFGKLNNVENEVPSISIVTGCKLAIDYSLEVLSRTKDSEVEANASDPDTVFSLVDSGILEAVLLADQGTAGYTQFGAPLVASVPIDRSSFTSTETGMSGDLMWNHFTSDKVTYEFGDTASVFGVDGMSISEFLNSSIGLRFYPKLNAVPAVAETGQACVRIRIYTIKAEVYFDSGSVEYYFASSDKSQIIKGTLVSSNVLTGNLRSGDGAGVLQLRPYLEIMDGDSPAIYDEWTIHSHYPPTTLNQVGIVDEDMDYNGLPVYAQLYTDKAKALFITANFYGDERLNAMYGANGVGRAFCFNGEDFYKIYTQPEDELDKPRHVAYHHGHLALGYKEGRVDVSVVGEPWNFSGVDGASSWGIGDRVTGLISLSGTVLGIFGDNSVTGLSGTTVDNFATQIISPRMGALEYTVVDMGYPVYANSYGIYTLSQTQQYGDFLGGPLSQSISPWLRPRLNVNDKETASVNIAWPVRTKNQYRLSFTDGYILTMTMNNGQQSTPTFSKQLYTTAV